MLADELDYVVGVDTDRDRHTLAIVSAPSGGVVAQRSVRTNARGYADAVRFAEAHAAGARAWAIEGAGHYGAGLARHLSGRGETVIESGRGPRDIVGCAARTTRSTRSVLHAQRSRARRSGCRGGASGVRLCGCCWSRDVERSTCAGGRSCSCAV
jgi:transposase